MSDYTGIADEWLQFEEESSQDRGGWEQFPLQRACDVESSEKSVRLEFAGIFENEWEVADDQSLDR